jgi:hypothetical protein
VPEVCILLLICHACILCCWAVPRACILLLICMYELYPLLLCCASSLDVLSHALAPALAATCPSLHKFNLYIYSHHPSLDPASLPNPQHPSLTLTRKRMDLESQIGRLIGPAYQTRQQHRVLLRRCLLAHSIPASPLSRPHTTTHASDTETLRQEPSNTQQLHPSNTLSRCCCCASRLRPM